MKSLVWLGIWGAIGLLAMGATPGFSQATITVGTPAGSDMEILEKAKQVASREGLTVKIVEYKDYRQLNAALVNKELDLNAFQHQPYLDEYNKANGSLLISLGSSYVSPLGVYSRKIKKLSELKEADTIVIPLEPANGGRALLLLEKAGVIKLKPGVGLTATADDILENPKNLIILGVEGPQTVKSLDEVAAAAIINTYSIPAGLNPLKNSIFLESIDSPYINVIAARIEDRGNPLLLKFVKAYQSQEVADYIYENFEYSIIPAFPHQKREQ
ncbi:MAG: MetQ/NlpA family ABC transporter substrate-binding protein [Deltaproteobacteria bacterium]|jgi:D-methionine transport system substrate-binding protein|nr:MetQ/NlpA family ABC transporter substrate-binding protein [Deltaproteobacteria bacterium]